MTAARDDPRATAYFRGLEPEIAALARRLDRLIRRALPAARRGYKWSVPFYYANGPICYLSASARGVSLGLLHGTEIRDATGMLQGTGRSPIRKAVFRPGRPVAEEAIADWLGQARVIDEEHLVAWA